MAQAHVAPDAVPSKAEIGDYGEWTLSDGSAEPFSFYGTFLGMGTSQLGSHNHPPGREPPPGGRSCSACRWSEIRLWAVQEEDSDQTLSYVIHVMGRSKVPGEVNFYKLEYPEAPDGVIRTLTTRRPSGAYIGHIGQTILATAGEYDDHLRERFEAYTNVS